MANSFQLHTQHLDFLVWLSETYGTRLKYVPFTSIMKKQGKLSYPSIWAYMEILTDYGYLTMQAHSRNKRIYKVDTKKLVEAKQILKQLNKKSHAV
jgi:hypothetical protein